MSSHPLSENLSLIPAFSLRIEYTGKSDFHLTDWDWRQLFEQYCQASKSGKLLD